MKRKLLLVALAVSLSASAFAQGIIHGSGDPTTLSPVPNCNPNRFYVDDSTQDMWQSNQGSPCLWVKSSSASGSGTVTHTGGALTADKVVAGAGAADAKATDLGYVTPNLTIPAGGAVGSADTGTPKFTFAANSITANQPLTVSGSTAIVPSSAASGDLGSALLPFQFLWFAGSSGTPATNNFKLIGASTSGTRTINAPDANTNLPIISQTLTFSGPTAARTYTVRDANATLATKTGSPATNDCAKFDANGELTTAGAACGGGGSVTSRDNLTGTSTLDFVPGDPTVVWAQDDFMQGHNQSNAIGSLGWSFTCASGTLGILDGVWPNLGLNALITGSTSTNSCSLTLDNGGNAYWGSLGAHTSSYWEGYFVFKLNATTSEAAYVGFAKANGFPPGEFFGIRYDTSAGDTNFMLFSDVGGTPATAVSMGVAADTSYHTLKIYTDGATAAKVFVSIDAGAAKTICSAGCDVTQVPSTSAQMGPAFVIETLTTATKTLTVDMFGFKARVSANPGKRN